MDLSKVWLMGQAISDPILTKIGSNRTPSASFLLQVNEKYKSEGKTNSKANVILIESLGVQASSTMERVRKGLRYLVEGYLRVDSNRVAVRTFSVNQEERDGMHEYYRGIEQALDILLSSIDKESAIESLRSLLAEVQDAADKRG